MTFAPGDWAYSKEHREVVRVVEARDLWNHVGYRVFVPSREATVRVAGDALLPVTTPIDGGPSRLTYAVAAARVADAIARDVLLAPLEGNVEPLPHQIQALGRAVSDARVRYLLADEVGLGKTIEAGLIMRELKLRGLVRRTLVVAPKGLVTQWVAEMKTHFNEEFRLLVPGEFGAYRRFAGDENLWRRFDQVVCPMDSVKPLDGRRGWSKEQVEQYNRERFGDLISAGWDLVIVDEAHRLGGSSDVVARFRLGEGLAEAAPYLLLLSATPHQGKTDAFHRILWLLDGEAFPDVGTVTRERVQPYVIRTEKRRAVDADGKPLFRPRRTQLVPVAWLPRHEDQGRLYEAVTEYVREGYNQAVREKRHYIGFLMILMQRLVTSSTRAIATTLEKRLEALGDDEDATAQRELFADVEWTELDGQEQLDILLAARLQALRNETGEVGALLDLARRCMAAPDAKAEALLDWMYRLQQEDGDPALKFLVFTEFVPTQAMLRDFLTERGFAVACLNGSMDMDARRRVQQEFAGDTRVLVSTDAGGEGLNLQFCRVVINYDLPWNPMRIEQRIGRVDRIGQKGVVRALNLVVEDSVEHRVREVLEAKLQTILEEFGVDKASDVLDSAEAEEGFETVYVGAMLDPTQLGPKVDSLLSLVRARAHAARDGAGILGSAPEPDPQMARGFSDHPLPTWVERMTVSYLEAAGGKAERDLFAWNLTWPDGAASRGVVFHQRQADETGAQLVSLEDARVRGIASALPRAARGQPVPIIRLQDMPSEVRGTWSLWRVALCAADERQVRVLPVFRHDDGRSLAPTARHVWDRLLREEHLAVGGRVEGADALATFDATFKLAESLGRGLFGELLQHHGQRLDRDRQKTEYAIARRARAIKRIGLAAVRTHRLAELDREAHVLRAALVQRGRVAPELDPVLLVRVDRRMIGWRDHVLAHFAPQTSRLTLVADPDGLLLEEGILTAIRERGFEIIPFDDPVAFRFAYESQYRQRWDRGENTELVVVLRAEEDDLRSLPFDLLQAGRRLPTFRLAHIFPKLSNPVVQTLDRSLLDKLYDEYRAYDGGELGDRSTKAFILRSVFRCAPELAKTPADVLRLLCEKHTRGDRFPSILDDHVVAILRGDPGLDWPLEKIVPDRDAFLRFLQDQWPAFVAEVAASAGAAPTSGGLPFDEVRAFVDTLFLDGALRPVPCEQPERLPEWAKVGVVVDAAASARRRLTALFERLERCIPSSESTYRDWQQFAWRWAELIVLKSALGGAVDALLVSRIDSLHDSIEGTFAAWMLARYASLANLVERDGRPVMLHHIARYLAERRRTTSERRLALIVLDGLAIDQWLLIRETLVRADPTLRMEESAVFAWVPTLTSVSRQTIFAGELPLLFADSLGTTGKEESHWRRVWEEADVPALSVGYRRNLGSPGGPEIDELADHPKMQVLGLVINTVDDIMHGMVLGTAGMHQSVRLWAEQGYLLRVLERLHQAGFSVYLTADHGNLEAVGQGRPREGSLVETRGERARVYESDVFRDQVAKEFPGTISWPGPGLPSNSKVLLADGRTAFIRRDERAVVHGGLALEEVLVPFVRLWRE